MKKIGLFLLPLFLYGCSTIVPVSSPIVLDFPESLLQECETGQMLDETNNLSENLKTIVQNNVKWAECRMSKRILIESIRMRQESLKSDKK
jgi:hypothetical protein